MLVNLKTKEEFYSLFKNGKFIGKGTTSTIYLKDGKVIKVYDLLKERTRILFNVFDMEEHLLELSKVNIKNVHVPKDIYTVAGQVYGLSLDYVEGYNLHDILNGIDINGNTLDISLGLFLEYLEELVEIIQKINESRIVCCDFHCGNVIINGNGINIIDTDNYYFDDGNSSINNFHCLFSHIFDDMFDIGLPFIASAYFHFYSAYLNSLLENYSKKDATKEDYFNLYRAISEELGYDTQISNVKKLVKELGEVKF